MRNTSSDVLVQLAFAALCLLGGDLLLAQEVSLPHVADDRLQLTLVAREPDIVTPTGLAADRQGNLYVIESHTHSRGSGYDGPPSDRVLCFTNPHHDGLLGEPTVYAEELSQALAMAFSPDGELFVVQMKSVVGLSDHDGDGRCDSRRTVLTIDTPNNNNHGVFLAAAIDAESWLYVSLGNIGGSRYAIEGTDGRQIRGEGDTGLIVRCRVDGKSLERFAQGFWNPCDLRFDGAGRLLATDNDPDARGPNRVLHVIRGGDYGYQARYGSSGVHPYCAWNGELPGTLPMAAGVGEAPVGLLECATTGLPLDYAEDWLVCVWGTNEVVRIRTRQSGVSRVGRVEPLITGDATFRPTGIVATADGAIYIADWADRRYPVHGKGRIWRLAPRSDASTLTPREPFAAVNSDPEQDESGRLERLQRKEDFEELVSAGESGDPFVASTALTALGQPVFRPQVERLIDDSAASRRLVGLLALRKAGAVIDGGSLRRLVEDADAGVRKMALITAGEAERFDLADEVRQTLSLQTSSADLFETFLATMELLAKGASTSGTLVADQDLIRSVLADEGESAAVHAMAVRYVTDPERREMVEALTRLARSDDPRLASEAIHTLGGARTDSVAELLSTLAQDDSDSPTRRCAAIMAFAASDSRDPAEILPLLTDRDPQVAVTAARALSGRMQDVSVRQAFENAAQHEQLQEEAAIVLEQLQFALGEPVAPRPVTDDEWRQTLIETGDARAGQLVFFDRRVSCSKCHRVDGRGGEVGPDLSRIATAKTREEILASILHPSAERSPDYQGYLVLMDDGRILKGTQFHFRGESAEMRLEDGRLTRFDLRDAVDYRALDESLMPDKLVDLLSVAEVRDLLTFLTGLRSDQGESPGAQ